MRIVLAFGAVIALSGCLEAQPSPAMVQLQTACDAGDLRSCEVIVSEERARKAAFAEIFSKPVDVYTPAPVAPVAMPQTTNCQPDFIGGMRCTTY